MKRDELMSHAIAMPQQWHIAGTQLTVAAQAARSANECHTNTGVNWLAAPCLLEGRNGKTC